MPAKDTWSSGETVSADALDSLGDEINRRVDAGDPRLADQRTPVDASVTDTKLSISGLTFIPRHVTVRDVNAPRPPWAGPVIWNIGYTPSAQPTNASVGDHYLDATGTHVVTTTDGLNLPTANAGGDVAEFTMGSVFTRTGTDDGNGLPITSRSWFIYGGPDRGGEVLSNTAALSFTPTTAGTYTLVYLVGNADGLGSDAMLLTAVAVGGGAINMVATNISWSPAAPAAGDAVTFSVTVRNDGTAPKPAGVITGVPLRLNAAMVAYNDVHTAEIAPGATATIPMSTYTAGGTSWTAVAGTHTLATRVNDVIPRRYEESIYDEIYTETFSVTGGVENGVWAPYVSNTPTGTGGIVAYPAMEFIDSLGVAVHFNYGGSYYPDDTAGRAQHVTNLQYLGINRLRDGWGNGKDSVVSWLLNTVRPALGGLEMAMVHDTADFGHGDTAGSLTIARGMRDEHKRTGLIHMLRWAEGPNEWDGQIDKARTFTDHLAAAYHEDAACKHVYVGTMSFANLNTESLYTSYGSRPTLDVGVSHAYTGNNYVMDDAIMDRVDRHFGHIVGPTKPVIYTETGTHTTNITPVAYVGQPEDAHRMFIPMLACDLFRRGRYQGGRIHARTYFYELYDKDVEEGMESHFGLYRKDNVTPKPGATSLHHLTRILRDGAATRPAARRVAGVTVSSPSTKTKWFWLTRSNGQLDLVIWQQERVFAGSWPTVLNPANATVTVTLPVMPTSLQRYQPTQSTGSSAIAMTRAQTFTVTSSEDVTIIRIAGV